jgi:outer membrane protein OmpA-like peptidoglycan-associated protein
MRKLLFIAFSILIANTIKAQSASSDAPGKKLTQLSIRAGIDMAKKSNFTAPAKAKLKGMDIGASFDKYWGWYGLGIDVDYMSNEAPVYDDALLSSKLLTVGGYNGVGGWYNSFMLSTTTSATKLTRAFVGIGPSLKYQSNNCKFVAELNLRGGVTKTTGSSLNFSTIGLPFPNWQIPFFTRDGDASGAATTFGTFHHDGYKDKLLATAKAQVRLNYYVSPKFGLNVAANYMYYFGSKARLNYLDVTAPTPDYWYLPSSFDLSSLTSVGLTAGVSYKINGSTNCNCSANKSTGKNSMTVNVKDEQTGQPLRNASVTLVGANGKTYTGNTDAAGTMVFKKIGEGNYTVSGLLNGIATTQESVLIGASNKNGTATLVHNDPRFTVVGKAINITKNAPEDGVDVTLKNNSKGSVKMGTSQNGTGEFSFQLDANSDYELVGKKANYISNIENISTKGLTRSQTLYVQLELGVQAVEVGKPIALKNIYYDLEKSNIREDASTDLKKVAQFMNDNPNQIIEISSYTDSRGSDDYNLKLSQDRADAVVKYLASKGIDKNRLKAKGYGEIKLVNKCANGVTCTETEHQANRRTELVVVSM